MAKAHPGFKAVQGKIAARQGIPMKNAGAILAASSRRASAKAKRANPRLKRVSGFNKYVKANYKQGICLIPLLVIVLILVGGDPPFDQVKGKIALHESANGAYKLNVNKDRTLDVGLYQLNTRHFTHQGRIGKEFDKIFKKYGISGVFHERVVAAITNDRLNEELARCLYRLKGLKAWTSSRKFITNLKGR